MLALALTAALAAPHPSPIPAVPTAVRVARADAQAITITWRRGKGATSRLLWREELAAWRGRGVGRATRTTFARRAGATYRFRVRACRGARCSRWSRVLVVPPDSSPDPGPAPAPEEPTFGPTKLGSCPVFPADNPWNQDVSASPVDPRSDAYIAAINRSGDTHLHADFGADPTYGIPYRIVDGAPRIPVTFTEYGDESDPGPYPVPLDTKVEAGSDHHVLVVDQADCRLYELYHARARTDRWEAGSGAVFDLRSNALRPDYWTSTDEAGLPILPGLVRRDEVAAGAITHALRFTVQQTQHAFIHPATHYGSSDDPDDPPLGLRLRLKAGYDLSRFHGQALVVLQALRRYGMFVADTGTSWFITGENTPGWDDADLDQLKTVPGTAFEVVKTGEIIRPPF